MHAAPLPAGRAAGAGSAAAIAATIAAAVSTAAASPPAPRCCDTTPQSLGLELLIRCFCFTVWKLPTASLDVVSHVGGQLLDNCGHN